MAGMSSMGNGVPSLFYMQQIFWAFVGTAIGVATLSNIVNIFLNRQRITSSAADPAKPKSFPAKSYAVVSAILREYSYYTPSISFRTWSFYLPPLGQATILLFYLVLILVTCFYRLDPKDLLEWEDIAYRAGFIAICQLPLLVLLAGKRNIIGLLTGVGYERLNILHRWVARCFLVTVIIHTGYWLTEWIKYDYVLTKIKADTITQKGIIAGALLLWLVFSSAAPVRGLAYQVFIIQHIISWLAFLGVLYTHVPAENQIWIFLPLGFWALDRVVRVSMLIYTNLSIFHRSTSSGGLLACTATFEKLDEKHTRIIIGNPPVNWEAGQHMFLTCHALAPLSSHPFSIASLPSDGKIEFIVAAKKGATKRFHDFASKNQPALAPENNNVKTVLLCGPYSQIRPLRQFDSVLFIAGSTGATFTVPLLRDIVRCWVKQGGVVTRYVRFVWVVKNESAVRWCQTQLQEALRDVRLLRAAGSNIQLDITIHTTSPTSPSPTPSTPRPSIAKPAIFVGKAGVIITSSDSERSVATLASIEKEKMEAELALTYQRNRPDIEELIRGTAEQALGEMAVVVCGPAGMVAETRNKVVKISDERAVCRGTGAQGIWVHGEGFGY